MNPGDDEFDSNKPFQMSFTTKLLKWLLAEVLLIDLSARTVAFACAAALGGISFGGRA
jgi:hypothetical protein